MFVRAMNVFVLAGLVAFPLYGAHTHFIRPAEHDADVSLLKPPRDQYLVSGLGAPRIQYADCTRDLAGFNTLLSSHGLTPIENVTCVPVAGEVESYAPSFRAIGSERIETSTVTGARYNSQSFCEIMAEKMGVELGRKNTVLEASCRGVRGSGLSDSDTTLFMPVIVLLTRSNAPDAAKTYSSIEVLVDSASEVTRRYIASAEAEAETGAAQAAPAAQ